MKVPPYIPTGFLCGIILFFCSCATVIPISKIAAGGDYCQPTQHYALNPRYQPLAFTDSLLRMEPYLNISRHDITVANILGVLPLLVSLNSTPAGNTLHKLILTGEISNRVSTVKEEIDGFAAELDCDGERTDQVAAYLDHKNQKKTTWLTAASIVTGAVTTIVAIALDDHAAQNETTIAGGLLTAGFSIFTINPSGDKVSWNFSRNALADVWNQPEASDIFPRTVWLFLNSKRLSNSGNISILEHIRERWVSINFARQVSDPDKERFFGKGGLFTAEDLHRRAAMINELQASVRSFHQDLAIFLNNIKN